MNFFFIIVYGKLLRKKYIGHHSESELAGCLHYICCSLEKATRLVCAGDVVAGAVLHPASDLPHIFLRKV